MEVLGFWVLFGLAVAVVLLTSLFKNVEWDARVKNAIASALSVLAAGAVFFFQGDFDTANFLQSALGIYGLSQLIYTFMLSGTVTDFKLATLTSSDDV